MKYNITLDELWPHYCIEAYEGKYDINDSKLRAYLEEIRGYTNPIEIPESIVNNYEKAYKNYDEARLEIGKYLEYAKELQKENKGYKILGPDNDGGDA